MEVSSLLVFWYKKNGRSLPWRSNTDAYRIWLSEIILQQTRVEQGLNYYLKFVNNYPNVQDLAAAPLDEVLKNWQGLGYYTRARNLHQTAKIIVEQYGGSFPANLSELKQLKGVGDYTAAAIASIAFDIPVAVVDGNVYRVLSRLFGLASPIDTYAGKRAFQSLAQQLIDMKNPGTYNQAIMDLGALVCTPHNAKCDECPLAQACHAFIYHKIESFPVKSRKIKISTRYFHYFLIKHDNYLYMRQRDGKDIWHSLYEFPLITTDRQVDHETISHSEQWTQLLHNTSPLVVSVSDMIKHQLTHQTIYCTFYLVQINHPSTCLNLDYKAIKIADIDKISVPKLIENYLSRADVKNFIAN